MHEETTAASEAPIADSTMVDDVAANSDPPPVSTILHSVQTFVDISFLHGSKDFSGHRLRVGLPSSDS